MLLSAVIVVRTKKLRVQLNMLDNIILLIIKYFTNNRGGEGFTNCQVCEQLILQFHCTCVYCTVTSICIYKYYILALYCYHIYGVF